MVGEIKLASASSSSIGGASKMLALVSAGVLMLAMMLL
jgi:hypothetical protein